MSVNLSTAHREWGQAAIRAQRNGRSEQRQAQAAFEAALQGKPVPAASDVHDAHALSPAGEKQGRGRKQGDASAEGPHSNPSPSGDGAHAAKAFDLSASPTVATATEASACDGVCAGEAKPSSLPAEPAARGRLPARHAIDLARLPGPASDAVGSTWQFDIAGQHLPIDSLRVQRMHGGELRVALSASDAPSATALQRLRQRLAPHGGTLAAWEGENP